MATKNRDKTYQIKITLRYSNPPIWRRLILPGNTTLAKLHQIIQVAMGWTEIHLHLFIIKNEQYSDPFDIDLFPVKNERKYRLSDVAQRKGSRFLYEYDFGDSWKHEILIEKITREEEPPNHARCIAGERACPPEDVGGIGGYARFLAAIKDPTHKEHEFYKDWLGKEFDPEAFDLERINRKLKRIRLRSR